MAKFMRVPNARIDFDGIAQILMWLIGLYLISAAFAYLQQYVMAGVAQKTVYDMREDVNAKLARLPLKFYDAHTHGEILSRVTNDIDNISNTLQQSATQIITSLVTILGTIIMMLTINFWLTMIAIVTLPISMIVATVIASRSQKLFAKQQKALGELNGHVEEMYTGHKIVKAFGHEDESVEQFGTINDRLYDAGWKAQFISGIIFPLLNFVNNIGYVLVAVVGSIFVTQRAITIGDVQAFIQYSRQFSMPVAQTANIANVIQLAVASAERVFELLDEAEEVPDRADAVVLASPRGDVRFEHVRFGYTPGEPLMEDMNIDVHQGQTIAIVGPTGAGKTTLVNLLMRFYEVESGKITVDGADIRDMKRGDLRSVFGLELVNRIDEVVTFQPLDADDVQMIVGRALADLTSAVERRHGVRVRVTPEAARFAAQQAAVAAPGARGATRTVERLVHGPLSALVLTGKLTRHTSWAAVYDEGGIYLLPES
jgi:ATP-binding cassette subfamily B protein